MTRRKPGLPENFALEIPVGDFEDHPPANIGDFLDEDDSPIRARPSEAIKAPSKSRSAQKVVGKIAPKGPSARRNNPERVIAVDESQVSSEQSTPLGKILRRQVNLTPDADRVINQLLTVIKRYSNEPHPNASDVVNALVLAAGEAVQELQLQGVPRRGKYGEPTVKIYLQQLKTAMQDAMVQHEKYKGIVDNDS